LPDDDNLPSSKKAVYTFFEFIALGCELESVPAFVRGHWPLATLLLIIGAVLLFIGRKSSWLHEKIASLWNALPSQRALAVVEAENANLRTQVAAMKAQIENQVPNNSPEPLEQLCQIAFDYLPTSPLEKGWTKSYNADGVANFSTDPDIPGSLRMKIVNSMVAITYSIPDLAKFSDTVKYTAKYEIGPHQTMIFTGIDVTTRDGSDSKRMWAKYYLGERHAEKTKNFVLGDPLRELHERTVWLPARVVKGGIAFDIHLPDVVRLAVGEEGWIFKSIWAVRIRGDVSISSITLGRAIRHGAQS
jgi:hypothetical protein